MRGHISFWKFIKVWYYWTLGNMKEVLKGQKAKQRMIMNGLTQQFCLHLIGIGKS